MTQKERNTSLFVHHINVAESKRYVSKGRAVQFWRWLSNSLRYSKNKYRCSALSLLFPGKFIHRVKEARDGTLPCRLSRQCPRRCYCNGWSGEYGQRESNLSGPTFAMLSKGSHTEDISRYVTLMLRFINKAPLIQQQQRKLLLSVSGKSAPCTGRYTPLA